MSRWKKGKRRGGAKGVRINGRGKRISRYGATRGGTRI